jgi:FkbM family methyltransferase
MTTAGAAPPLAVAPRPPWWVRVGVALVRRLPAARYRAMNLIGRRRAPLFYARTGPAVGGHRFVCDLRDLIAREVCFTGQYEPQETALVRALLGPGDTFVDVGANWGYFTLLGAARVGPAGRVVGLEPEPRLFELLAANVRANQLDQVTVLPVAASDGPGEVQFTGFDAAGGNWGLSKMGGSGANGFTARTVTVDAQLDDLGVGRVDLLKMDIEGAEDLALAGMTAGLAAGRYERILLELHPALLAARGRPAEAVVRSLSDAGYRAWVIPHSREATRRAAYARSLDPRGLLTPWEPGTPLGDWPHLLFARGPAFPAATRPGSEEQPTKEPTA